MSMLSSKTLKTLLLACISFSVSSINAEEVKETPKKKKKSKEIFVDKNKDNKITKEDLPKNLQKEYKEIDYNNDGEIDSDEQEVFLMTLKERKVEAVIKKYDESIVDKNKNGKITKEDLSEKDQKKFAKIDKNKDGKIDEKEKKDFLWATKNTMLNGKKSAGGKTKKKKKD